MKIKRKIILSVNNNHPSHCPLAPRRTDRKNNGTVIIYTHDPQTRTSVFD